MNELKFNVVQSIGEITANFDEFKNQVSQELEKYKSKEFTEDTKKDAKKDLAELRKKKAAVNERRIEVKKEYMKPYDEFEAKVKELITLIDEPITLIDYKVKEFEEKRINERKEEILLAYEEIVPGELQDYIPLERIYGKKWTNAGTKMKDIIFCGSRRKISERYGFVIPLAPYLHEFQKGSVHDNPNHGLDLELKQMAQRYFEEHIGSREEFREVFGKSWL